MAFSSGDPIEYGKELADRTKSPWDFAGQNVMDQFKKKKDADLLVDIDKRKKSNDLEMEEASTKRLMDSMGGGDSSSFMPSEYKVGNVTYKNPKYSEEVKRMQTEAMLERERNKKDFGAGAQSGSINAAVQSKKAATKALNILFPDGTPKSFRREVAMGKGWLGAKTLSKDAQDLTREFGVALDMFNKQVTGLAFSKEEYANRVKQFQIDLTSNPEAAYNSIKKLYDMSDDYLKISDPQGLYDIEGDAQSNQNPIQQAAANQSSKFQEGYESKAGYVKLNGKWYKKNG